MSSFEIDKYLKNNEELELIRSRWRESEAAERRLKLEAGKGIDDLQMKVASSIVRDLIDSSKLIPLLKEINARAFNNRRILISKVTSLEPDHVSTRSYRVEFGPTHTSTHKVPANAATEVSLESKKKKGKKEEEEDLVFEVRAQKNRFGPDCLNWTGSIRIPHQGILETEYVWDENHINATSTYREGICTIKKEEVFLVLGKKAAEIILRYR